MAKLALGEEDAPDPVTLWRKIRAMGIRQEGSITTVRNGNDVPCLIPDATGLTPVTRSDWIHHKHRKARGFIKLSVMINQETREILALLAADERKGDPSQFKDLVDGSLEALGLDPESPRAGILAKGAAKSRGTDAAAVGSRVERSAAEGAGATGTAGSAERYGMLPFCPARHAGGQFVIELRADAEYYTRQIFECCKGLGIVPLIRIKKNGNSRAGGMGGTRGPGCSGSAVRQRSRPEKTRRAGRVRARPEPEGLEEAGRLRPTVAGGDRVLVAQEDVRRFRKRSKDGKHRPGDRNKDQHVQQVVGGGMGSDRRSMNVELSQAPALGSRRCH